MDLASLLIIMPKYNNCPDCGSDKIGNGQGWLVVEEDILVRTCKCGFKVVVDKNGREIEKVSGNKNNVLSK